MSRTIDPICSLSLNEGCFLPLQGLGEVVEVRGGEEVVERGEGGEEGAEGDSGVGVVEGGSRVREAVVGCVGEDVGG